MATATATTARATTRSSTARGERARGGIIDPTASSDGRAGATYESRGTTAARHAEEETRTRRFDTASARGVTTFDARTCEAIEFVPIDAWSRDKANFEKLRSMRTFRSAQTVEGVRDDARARAKEKVSARARAV